MNRISNIGLANCRWVTTASKTYDIAGNVKSSKDANRNSTTFIYTDSYSDGQSRNTFGNPTTITNAAGQTATLVYHYNSGKAVSFTDPNNIKTTYTYNVYRCGRKAKYTGHSGALYSKYPAQTGGSIAGGAFGTVAVQNDFLGLSVRQLRTYGTQIFVTPGNQGLISQYGGPTGPLSVSDHGDANIQATRGMAFDLYRFPTVAIGRQFGRRTMSTTTSFPTALAGGCPAGFTQVP